MNDLGEIAAKAAKKRLPVLLAGGHAVMAHGYQRTTFDADLTIPHKDRDSWLEMMRDLGFVLYHEGPGFLQFHPRPGGNLPVDLMFTSEETFNQLNSDAIENPQDSNLPKIISLRSLIAMKCHAIVHGHPGRIVKDADDVIHLFLANHLDPNASEWRDILLKYGNPEFHEKLTRICQT